MPVIRSPMPHGLKTFRAVMCGTAHRSSARLILMGRTTKDPGPCEPYIHKHDHEDIIVMLQGSFTLRVGEGEVTLGEGDTLIIPPDTVHTPVAAGPDGCELIGMPAADIRSFQPDGTEIGVGFESLKN